MPRPAIAQRHPTRSISSAASGAEEEDAEPHPRERRAVHRAPRGGKPAAQDDQLGDAPEEPGSQPGDSAEPKEEAQRRIGRGREGDAAAEDHRAHEHDRTLAEPPHEGVHDRPHQPHHEVVRREDGRRQASQAAQLGGDRKEKHGEAVRQPLREHDRERRRRREPASAAPEPTVSHSREVIRGRMRSAGRARPAAPKGGRIVTRPRRRVSRAVADEGGRARATVDGRQAPDHRRRQERAVPDGGEVLGDPPEIVRRRHPAGTEPVEAGEVDRQRVGSEGPLPPEVHVAVEVAHHELAETAVDRLAVPEPREVRLGDGAPAAVEPERRRGRDRCPAPPRGRGEAGGSPARAAPRRRRSLPRGSARSARAGPGGATRPSARGDRASPPGRAGSRRDCGARAERATHPA